MLECFLSLNLNSNSIQSFLLFLGGIGFELVFLTADLVGKSLHMRISVFLMLSIFDIHSAIGLRELFLLKRNLLPQVVDEFIGLLVLGSRVGGFLDGLKKQYILRRC
jgi:hypothetical protein